jgi:hypothetical protein
MAKTVFHTVIKKNKGLLDKMETKLISRIKNQSTNKTPVSKRQTIKGVKKSA